MMELTVGDIFKITLFPEDGVYPKGPGDISRTKYVVVFHYRSLPALYFFI